MNTSAATGPKPELALMTELRGLDTREQFAATLHFTTEQFISQGGTPEDAAYFLISAARAVLDQESEFSPDTLLAREYLHAGLELL